MKTREITFLCALSDRIYNNARRAEKMDLEGLRSIRIETTTNSLVLDVGDYPELKPLAEKIFEYVKKSEESKQIEIKTEIGKLL